MIQLTTSADDRKGSDGSVVVTDGGDDRGRDRAESGSSPVTLPHSTPGLQPNPKQSKYTTAMPNARSDYPGAPLHLPCIGGICGGEG